MPENQRAQIEMKQQELAMKQAQIDKDAKEAEEKKKADEEKVKADSENAKNQAQQMDDDKKKKQESELQQNVSTCSYKSKDYLDEQKKESNSYWFNQIISQRNHYNNQQRKCFVLVTVMGVSNWTFSISLLDLYENKGIGSFIAWDWDKDYLYCEVWNYKCINRNDFDKKITPYMEN